MDEEEVDEMIVEVLNNRRRRLVIRYLRNTADQKVPVEELATYVNTYSQNRRGGQNAAIRLHHLDLSKLEAAGVIEYDQRNQTVRYRRRPEVDRLVDLLGKVDPK